MHWYDTTTFCSRAKAFKEQLKNRVVDVVSCDLFNREKGKFLPEKYDREGSFDVVLTSLLLEAVIQDLDTYAKVIKRRVCFMSCLHNLSHSLTQSAARDWLHQREQGVWHHV